MDAGRCEEMPRSHAPWLAPFVAFALALLVKLPQLGFGHREPDEVIYWQLAQRLWQDGVHSLRGTRVLELLPASMYDQPLFHHPPLFAALLGPWAANSAAPYPPDTTVWITWIAHAVFAAAATATGLRLAARSGARIGLVAGLLGATAAALDPFGWFASRFLWIDAVSMACAALAAWCALGRSGPRWFAAAGAFCALAALAKLTGGVVLAALAAERWFRRDAAPEPARRRARTADLVALFVLPVVLVGGWLALFRAHTGAWLPTWIAPDADVLARDALMARGFSRSPLAYLWLVPLVQPLALWLLAAAWRERRDDAVRALLAWLVLGGAAIAATSLLGTTPVLTRQFAPVYPALYIAAIALVARLDDVRWRAAFCVGVALAAAGAWRDVHAASVYELRGLMGWT